MKIPVFWSTLQTIANRCDLCSAHTRLRQYLCADSVGGIWSIPPHQKPLWDAHHLTDALAGGRHLVVDLQNHHRVADQTHHRALGAGQKRVGTPPRRWSIPEWWGRGRGSPGSRGAARPPGSAPLPAGVRTPSGRSWLPATNIRHKNIKFITAQIT